MSTPLADIESRLGATRQLQSIVGTVRGIAAARSAQAAAALSVARSCDEIVATALALAARLPLPVPAATAPPLGAPAVILFGPEHGFVGDLCERLLDAAGGEGRPPVLLVIGSRALAAAHERDWPVAWHSPAATQVGSVQAVARRTADALAEAVAGGRIGRADIVCALAGGDRRAVPRRRPLLPFDPGGPAARPPGPAPLAYLSAGHLMERLTEEYVFAELARSALESFAGENSARLQTMSAAYSHIGERLDSLVQRERDLRQEQVTGELLDLVAGAQV